MPRSWDDDFFWPAIGGTGIVHDMNDQEPLPRLYGMKSVSKAAAWALADTSHYRARKVGFVKGKIRSR